MATKHHVLGHPGRIDAATLQRLEEGYERDLAENAQREAAEKAEADAKAKAAAASKKPEDKGKTGT